MKTAYLDCFSGISGDMFVGALLNAGLSFERLQAQLGTLNLPGYGLKAETTLRNHISGTHFVVETDSHDHVSRHLSDIRKIIHESGLSSPVKSKGIAIFERIARVEGQIHNIAPDKVHFHEVGAVDSIIDIMAAVTGLEDMGISTLYASHIPLGSGFIKTEHGVIPVPAPATIELLKGIPIYDSGVKNEIVTPTGAALLKCLCTSFGPMPPMEIDCIGYGAGTRELPDRPNMLRILVGEETPSNTSDEKVVILETNLDDASPEWMGYLMERLLGAGALDVAFIPIQMKKNRPGVQIQVIGHEEKQQVLTDILFRESTTLGIRIQHATREVLKRSEIEVDSPWGKLSAKKVINRDGSFFIQPEYEICRQTALKQDLPLKDIYAWIMGLNK